MKKQMTMILMFTFFTASAVLARGGNGERRGPPPEAIQACESAGEGSECSFSGRRGDTLTGTCVVDRDDNLACRPENHRERSSSEN